MKIPTNTTLYVRFARLKAIAKAESKDGPPTGKNLEAAQPSDKYMSFSYGRSSCPGRWFAIRLLKLMIAYITVHYDITSFWRIVLKVSRLVMLTFPCPCLR
ncbi:hypothetical protein V8E54_005349 [Elaphomyces granulatus]